MRRGTDWLGVAIRFACGAPVGALFGLGSLATDASQGHILLCVVAGATIGGTLSAAFGDAFWESAWSWLWWW